MFTTIT